MYFIYKCSLCGKEYERDEVKYLCPECSIDYKPVMPLKGVLEAIFDYEYIYKKFDFQNPDWAIFSAIEKKFWPEYPCGNTPFHKLPDITNKNYFSNVWIKNDGLNPSGSLKDRASFLIVAEANRINEKNIVAASTGNAASALAAVCASAGKKAIIFVPAKAPKAKLLQMLLYGAKVIPVKGSYDDAFKLSLEYTKIKKGLNRNTAYHPLTIEGKKTAGLEIFEQNHFKVPDLIIIPVGDGVIISGIYKAFFDLKEAKIIDRMPRLVCVQAEKSNAIHNFIISGKYTNADNPATIADSISVSIPSNAYLAKKAIEKTNGISITVSDEEILSAQKELAKISGIFAEPAAAASFAGLKKLESYKDIRKDAQIVLLITGHGLKDIDTPLKHLEIPEAIEASIEELEKIYLE